MIHLIAICPREETAGKIQEATLMHGQTKPMEPLSTDARSRSRLMVGSRSDSGQKSTGPDDIVIHHASFRCFHLQVGRLEGCMCIFS